MKQKELPQRWSKFNLPTFYYLSSQISRNYITIFAYVETYHLRIDSKEAIWLIMDGGS